jgi:hypothetical protein
MAMLPREYLGIPQGVVMLEARANLLLRYVQSGVMAEPAPPAPPRMRMQPIDDAEEIAARYGKENER